MNLISPGARLNSGNPCNSMIFFSSNYADLTNCGSFSHRWREKERFYNSFLKNVPNALSENNHAALPLKNNIFAFPIKGCYGIRQT